MNVLRRIATTVALLLVVLPGAPLLTGCAGPSYYAQAAAGQIELIRGRQEIAELLADPATDPELASRLHLAREVVSFGSESLGLPADDSYTQFTRTGRSAVIWNVVAAPEFSLEPKTWCFLVAGCVPYRGYFEKKDAERFADMLRGKGYDVVIAPATAYSTLGWFDDPLLDTMFLRGDTALAGVLFHEMAHRVLYVKDDTAFNESFASFVEETAVWKWLEYRDDPSEWKAWRHERDVARALDILFAETRSSLLQLYASDQDLKAMRAEKERILEAFCEASGRALPPSPSGTGHSEALPRCRANNANFALRASYHSGGCAFERLFDASGRQMSTFLERARQIAALAPAERKKWLNRRCTAVAPDGNL